jgi:hypothetical protein
MADVDLVGGRLTIAAGAAPRGRSSATRFGNDGRIGGSPVRFGTLGQHPERVATGSARSGAPLARVDVTPAWPSPLPRRLLRAAQCEPDVPRRVHEGECASAGRDAGHAFSLTAISAPTLQVGTGDVAGWHRRRARPDPCVTAGPKLGTIRRSDKAPTSRSAPRVASLFGLDRLREVRTWPAAENRLSTPTSQPRRAAPRKRLHGRQPPLTSQSQPREYRRSQPSTSEASTLNWGVDNRASEFTPSTHHV